MRSSIMSGLVYIGTIFLAFGLVISVIELFAVLHGTPHDMGWTPGLGLLIGGALLAGAGTFARRSDRKSDVPR